MQTARSIHVCTHLAPWIVAILAILVWGIRGPHRATTGEASRRRRSSNVSPRNSTNRTCDEDRHAYQPR